MRRKAGSNNDDLAAKARNGIAPPPIERQLSNLSINTATSTGAAVNWRSILMLATCRSWDTPDSFETPSRSSSQVPHDGQRCPLCRLHSDFAIVTARKGDVPRDQIRVDHPPATIRHKSSCMHWVGRPLLLCWSHNFLSHVCTLAKRQPAHSPPLPPPVVYTMRTTSRYVSPCRSPSAPARRVSM